MVDEIWLCPFLLMIARTIMPQLSDRFSTLLGFTTPRSKTSRFGRWIALTDKNTGEPLLNVVRLGEACQPCERGPTPWTCNHFDESLRPPWKSGASIRRLGQLYEGMEDIQAEEVFAISSGGFARAFSDQAVDRLMLAEPYVPSDYRPSVIWLGADPAGAGPSDFGIAAVWFEGHRMVVRARTRTHTRVI